MPISCLESSSIYQNIWPCLLFKNKLDCSWWANTHVFYLWPYLDFWVKVTRNVALFPLHCVTYAPAKFHVTNAPAKFEVAMSNSSGGEDFLENTFLTLLLSRSHKTLPSTLYIMWPFTPAKFGVALSNLKCSTALIRKYIFGPCFWSWGQGHIKHCPVPSASCDLCTCKIRSCYIRSAV